MSGRSAKTKNKNEMSAGGRFHAHSCPLTPIERLTRRLRAAETFVLLPLFACLNQRPPALRPCQPPPLSAHQTTGNFPDARLGRNLCILDKVSQIIPRLGYCRCQCHQHCQRCLRWISMYYRERCIYKVTRREQGSGGGHANELLRGREYAQSYSTVKTMPRSCKEMRKLR